RLLVIENEFASFALFPEHGTHIASFAPVGEEDLLWMSGKSCFERNAPIRGGIPICWPWFGAHPSDASKPPHGFARIAEWTLDSVDETSDGGTRVLMSLSSGDGTLAIWPFAFELTCEVVVAETLKMALSTLNIGDAAFEITQALHSYFNVGDSERIAISGLDGARYIDTIDDNAVKTQEGDVEIHSEVDRVYMDTVADCVITDQLKGRTLKISKTGSRSTVVWNPWSAKSARMPDFGVDEYTGMVCVETTNALSDSISIAPGASHTISAEIASSHR
ncbi:MAG: D-hexose-6-phosphate mutarotase, partial [Victivallales bacterium]|nr:D-hexose-6-phosphate mutarotase [Victivallales bacterium]